MRFLKLLAVGFIFPCAAFAQAPGWLWAITSNGGNYQYGYALNANPANEIFFTGRIAGTATIGGQTANATGAATVVHGKFDGSGTFAWFTATPFSGGFDYPWGFARDAGDNTYSTGTINSGGGVFVQKCDNSGTQVWGNSIMSGNPSGNGVAVDGAGNVYMVGGNNGAIDFTVTTLNALGGGSDIFLAKFNSAGTCLWAVGAGGTGYDAARAVTLDQAGNIYVSGGYTGAPTFGSIVPPAAGAYANFFIAKYDPAGTPLWVTTASSAGVADQAWWEDVDLTIDSCGNLYVTGHFQNTAQFGGQTITSAGVDDIFVAKYLNDGTLEWVRGAGGSGTDQGIGISLDKHYDVYITGIFQNAAVFGATTLISAGSTDAFVAKYANSTGDLVWAQSGGGTTDDNGTGITVDNNGFVYITGSYNGTGVYGSSNITASASGNIFIAKLDTTEPLQILVDPDSTYCPGLTTTLPYTIIGTFNGGNIFTAQLSDANGSFTNPVDLGTFASTTSGAITITIPVGTPTGTGYIIRIISSSPAYSSYDYCFRVSINANLPVTLSNDTTVCSGSQVQLNASGGTDYTWLPSAGLSCTNCPDPIATVSSTTTYTVNISDGLCSTTDSIVINISTSLAVNAGSDTNICNGSSLSLLVTGASSYTWSSSPSLSCTNCQNPTATPASTETYFVVGSNASGCSGSDSIVVSVTEIPATPIIDASDVCEGESILLSTDFVVGAIYSWTGPNSFTSSSQNPTVANGTAADAGTYSLSIDVNGCTSSVATIDIAVNPLPIVLVSPSDTAICENETATLSASGALNYEWQPATGLSTTANALVDATPTVNSTYTVTGTDSNGCSANASTAITVTPIPSSSFTATSDICVTNEATIAFTGSASATATYTWNFGTAVIVSGTGSGPYQLSFGSSGNYVVELVVTDNGCTSTLSSQTINVTDAPTALFQIVPASLCVGETAMVTYTGNATAFADFDWSFPIGSTIISGSGVGPISISFSDSGVQLLSLSVSENGCASSIVIDSVVVNSLPDVDFSAPITAACGVLNVAFQNNSFGGDEYNWTFGDGTGSTEMSPTHNYAVGTYDVTLVATNAFGCIDSLTISDYINVVPYPVAAFTSNPDISEPTQISNATFAFNNESQFASSFLWLFGDDSTSMDGSPTHQYFQSGEFSVTLYAYNDLGCVDTFVMSPYIVTGNNVLFIPNTFTPNGDGINDVFEIHGRNIANIRLSIFDRWGERLFDATDGTGWDGVYKGHVPNTGVFVYVASVTFLDNTIVTRSGDINLLR